MSVQSLSWRENGSWGRWRDATHSVRSLKTSRCSLLLIPRPPPQVCSRKKLCNLLHSWQRHRLRWWGHDGVIVWTVAVVACCCKMLCYLAITSKNIPFKTKAWKAGSLLYRAVRFKFAPNNAHQYFPPKWWFCTQIPFCILVWVRGYCNKSDWSILCLPMEPFKAVLLLYLVLPPLAHCLDRTKRGELCRGRCGLLLNLQAAFSWQ